MHRRSHIIVSVEHTLLTMVVAATPSMYCDMTKDILQERITMKSCTDASNISVQPLVPVW
jgi:hypothetical protein